MNNPFSTKKYSTTNVDEVKRLNANSGLSYNEVKLLLAKSYQEEKQQK
ncbi:hypothetical protein IMZ08_19540 [Bacillus luteolus]|uniref:DNA mismatch repair protein MutT n=1 Tax=Litchfieldia luteola TaxID=682179 RepID=A0ABR9QP04_9BACI|nr:hypothetical protein [Cytobacillus luteolus]MBE4910234.1 hypothetical protein [Cytobacillus luteolus]MBP1942196.1 hypothetical protein [Cytobacillus luteolus]